MRQPVVAIRNVIAGLGTCSIATALVLASFGLFASHVQKAGLDNIILLQTTLHNHQSVKSAIDNLRTDILRSEGDKLGWNQEGTAAIGGDVWTHASTARDGIQENLALPLPANLHDRYLPIVGLVDHFLSAFDAANLELSHPLRDKRNYDMFRATFTPLEDAMNEVRDVLEFRLSKAEEEGAGVAAFSQQVIIGSVLAGVMVLALITWVAMRIVRKIALDLASSRAEAHRLALHDTLTGLPNRAMFAERVTDALEQMRRSNHTIAMLCVDLDRFKQVNDTLGHPSGDKLLARVADRLRTTVRDGDTVARLGGDEFAIVQCPIAGAYEVRAVAERLIRALSLPYDIDGQQVTIGASIGVAFAPDDTVDGAELLKLADLALYRAKSDGRGVFRFFEAGMDTNLQARQRLETELRVAVDEQQFEVFYQPLIELASNRVIGFEALIRWRHPDRGLVSPDDFIPIAEETGLIVPMGDWVLRQACVDAMAWPPHISVAVNISAVQFRSDALKSSVLDALAFSGLEPSRLELEFTETALLTDARSTFTILQQLQAFGVRIAMDDFGTGYSSLSYLRSFPFNKIKIDQSFVREIETDRDCKSIVRAVVALGLSLGISTTAEGVESQSQVEYLRAEGCDVVQGYYFSRPVPAIEVPHLLSRLVGSIPDNKRERCESEISTSVPA